MTEPADWALAGRWAGRLADPGPTATRAELGDLVASLHEAAVRAVPLARRAGRFDPALATSPPAQVLVVDRAGWCRAAGASFAGLTRPAGRAAPGRHPDQVPTLARSTRSPAASRAGTVQAAGLLALLAPRVLGQLDPFAPGAGRLVLVAPNLLQAQRSMGVDGDQLRLWVAVHEQTHAWQLAAAPWLPGYLRAQVAALLDQPGPDAERSWRSGRSRRAPRPRGAARRPEGSSLGVLGLVLDADQVARVEAMSAAMAVLEGHADVTMDRVPGHVLPDRRRLRAAMTRRRTSGGVDALLRRALGLDAKLAQYREGASFVRGVRRVAGPRALDPVWTAAEHLPSPAELVDPAAWVARVHG